MELNENEVLIRKSRATHRKGIEGVGGKLYLTNQRLYFKSYFFNIQSHEETIPIQSIDYIEAEGSDFLSAKMSIHLKSGAVEIFHMPKRKEWVHAVQNSLKN